MFTKDFIQIHNHTYYSLLDGMGSPEEKVLRAKELGMKALAITDHNHLSGIPEFYMACKKHNIKPLFGVELYWTWDSNKISLDKKERDKIAIEQAEKAGLFENKKLKATEKKKIAEQFQYDTKGYHIILIAKNQKGWENLIAIQSEAAEIGLFNGRYHCDNELLKKYSEGLICTTACIGSVVCDLLRKYNYEKAKQILLEWIDIFGKENLFCEIQGLDWDEQFKVNKDLIQLSKELGLNVIATNDCHYTFKEDIDIHDTLLCIGIGKLKNDENRMKYEPEFWMKDYDEMITSFKRQANKNNDKEYMIEVEKALYNTNKIADMVDDNIRIGSEKDLFPNVKVPEGYTENSYLKYLCWTRLYEYLKKKKRMHKLKVYEERLTYELNVIVKKGFAGYMLTVMDAIQWGDKNGAPFGPGRGSGAGSLVLFLLGIVKGTDPVEYNLLFSRFLTEDRTSPPDIDSDVSYTGRQKLLNYLQDTYGHDNISQVGTVTKLGVKNGISDICRVLSVPFNISKSITKKIDEIMDNAPSYKFKDLDNLKNNEKTLNKYNEFKTLEAKYSEIFSIARRLEGVPRNEGIHAGGVLICPMPINKVFPTKVVDGRKVTVWDKDVVEQMGGIKFDYLGLKTVSVIDLCLEYIAKNTNTEKINLQELYETIDIAEENAFKLINDKKTEAVFQMESDLFKSVISEMKPTDINDVIALTALCRPGPLSAKMDKSYNNRKNGLEEITYPLEGLEDILGDSYGTIIYQEHCMLIAKKIAGFDDNQADSYLRKALAKSHKEKMELCRQWLIYGKINKEAPQGYDENNKNQVMYDPKGKYGSEILGAINNGYTEKELIEFWDMLKDYSSYLFNKSHSTSYSLITIITAYLKAYYPTEYWAALLTIQDNKDKRAKYLSMLESEGIEINAPNINTCEKEFIPLKDENKILFGLSAINGVGETAIDEILKLRPFTSLEDIIDKVPKKSFNKKVGTSLIKAGALNEFNQNRSELINTLYDLRKDKDERLNTDEYNELVCMEYEEEVLGTTLTYKPWWNSVETNKTITVIATINNVRELIDRNGNMMAFISFVSNHCVIEGVVFAKTYCNHSEKFDLTLGPVELVLKGKKDEKGKFIVSSIKTISM